MADDDPTTSTPGPAVQVHGDATPEQVVAIAAAMEAVWPRGGEATPTVTPSRWRFSGRWWTKPVPSRRDRP